jgi:hypothetical protein
MTDFDAGKGTVALVASYEDMLFIESLDIWKTISYSVAEEAKVKIEAPTSIETEGIEHDVDGSEVVHSFPYGRGTILAART